MTRRDRFFLRLGGKGSPLGYGFGDLWRKENKVVRYAWWIGSRKVYIFLRPTRGVALWLKGWRPKVSVSRSAFPRWVRRPFCSWRTNHRTNRWIIGWDAFECLCGAERLTGLEQANRRRNV